jgi:ABC-type spermidine/putrescine transport system permease subunit II
MEKLIMTNELHKPFIKSLILAAIVTIFAMVSSKYVVEYYGNYSFSPKKTTEYSSQKSHNELKSVLVE